jgi:alkyl hydroperoxide reductase subunit AhpC
MSAADVRPIPGSVRHLEELHPMRKIVLGLLGLSLVASPALAGKYNRVISVGQKAPDFANIPAVVGSKDTTISLNDIKEDVVVLVFLANHCPVVTVYEDRIIDFAKEYEGKNVKVIGVAVDDRDADRLPAIRERVKEKGYPFVYGYDESQQIGRAYGATNTPQFFVLDKNRVIRYTGAMDDSATESKVSKTYLKDAVDALLKGESIETTETKAVGCGIPYKRSRG